MAETVASFSLSAPAAAVDRAAAMMVPEHAGGFKEQYAKSSADLARRGVRPRPPRWRPGVEAINVAASVAVILRAGQAFSASRPVKRRERRG